MSIRILVVDDHDHVRRVVCRLLRNEPDFSVVGEAVTGSDALTKAEEIRPDVVLLDISLPDIDGLKLAKSIATNESRSRDSRRQRLLRRRPRTSVPSLCTRIPFKIRCRARTGRCCTYGLQEGTISQSQRALTVFQRTEVTPCFAPLNTRMTRFQSR